MEIKETLSTMDATFRLAMIKGNIESLEHDIRIIEEQKNTLVVNANNFVRTKAIDMLGLLFTNYDFELLSDLIYKDFGMRDAMRFNVNNKYEVAIPTDIVTGIDVSDIAIYFNYGSPISNYNRICAYQEFAGELVRHINLFQAIIDMVYEIQTTCLTKAAKMNSSVLSIKSQIEDLEKVMNEVLVASIMKGEKLYFHEQTGKRIFTKLRRPEYYRWIEIKEFNGTKKTVTIRGLIREEVRHWHMVEGVRESYTLVESKLFPAQKPKRVDYIKSNNNYRGRPYYSFTGKDVLFEQKGVRLSTLLCSLAR
jgi:hypothetical protein